MQSRLRITLRLRWIGLVAATFGLASVRLDARQTPTSSPSRPASAVHSGDWFGTGKPASTKAEIESATLFAEMYPELARADKAVRDATPRVLWDAMWPKGKPKFKLPSIMSANSCFTDASFLAARFTTPLDPWKLVPDERKARMAAVDAKRSGSAMFLDIEDLPLDVRKSSVADVDRSVRMIAKNVGWMRAQDPNVRVFFYAGFPIPENYLGPNRLRSRVIEPGADAYEWWKAKGPEFEKWRETWHAANEHLGRPADPKVGPVTGLSELFDGVCPSLYLYDFPELAEAKISIPGFVRETVNESRRYGKPVYPFVWYLFADKLRPIPLEMWTSMMREVLTWADGAILWDAPETQWSLRLALRVRIATVLAERHGAMTDAEVYAALKPEFPNDPELAVLQGKSPATTPTMQP